MSRKSPVPANYLTIAAWLVVTVTLIIGIAGIFEPDGLTAIRRQYFATTITFYAAATFRMAMGLVTMRVAPSSRTPTILRILGGIMCLQGLTAIFLGAERARAVLEWETAQGHALLRAGACVALAAGAFIAYSLSSRGRPAI